MTAGTNSGNGTLIDGAYGTLRIGADGTYTYALDDASVDALNTGDTVEEKFTYTLTNGQAPANPDALINFGEMTGAGDVLNGSEGEGFSNNWAGTSTIRGINGSLNLV